jgi:hypothetical protein
VRSSRSHISTFAVVTIELKNGTDIDIPNILVDHLDVEHKLEGIQKAVRYRFPLVRA